MDSNTSVNPRNRAMSRLFPKAFGFGHRKSLSSSSSSNSSSSSSRCFPEDTSSPSPLGPSTPLRYPSGVPFSWEKLPGIPKIRPASGRRNDSAASLKLSKLLPLPPSATPRKHGNRPGEGSFRKKSSPEWDPFVAALVECSKEDNAAGHHHHDNLREEDVWTGAKVSRSVSDRFGFTGLYASCKRTPAVDESTIYIPRRSSRP